MRTFWRASSARPRLDSIMFSVDLVSDNAGFLAMAGEWNDAVQRAAVPHPFLRHEWVRAWWEAFQVRETQQLHVLVVRNRSRVCAIAPLLTERAHMYGVPVRRLRLMQNDHTPRTDFIVADCAEESYRALWHALRNTVGRWDVMQLSQLPSASPTLAAVRSLAAFDGCRTGVWQSGAAPYLKVDTPWSACLAGLSAKLRQNLRNRMSRLSQHGEPGFEMLADSVAIRASGDDARRLEESGWKEIEGTSIASDAAVERFYTHLAERAAECPWLRLLFLNVGGRRIAAAYAAVYDNRLFFLKTGYDPAFAKCSPFKLLTSFALRHACDQGLSEIDFLGDSEPWKLEWTSTTRPHDWLFVFGGTPTGRLLHPLKFQFVPAIRRCTSQRSRV
jgi:CelD/BcsL family acetyltransferase involved in cellulose biosynthesis